MRKIITKRPLCFACLLYVFITYIILTALGGVDINQNMNDFKSISVTGYIYDKSHKNGNEILHLDNCVLNGNIDKKSKYMVYINDGAPGVDYYKIGQKVVIKGQYSNFDLPENEGQFNMRKYYRTKGIDAKINNADILAASIEYDKIKNTLFDIREKTKQVYYEYYDDEKAGIMSALVLGDKDNLDKDIKSLYQDAGIAHILSLSGLHIATVGMALLGFLKKRGMPIKIAAFISITIMLMYGIMTGMSTSTIRALIMFILGIIARCVGRTYDLLTAVAFSALLILIENPYYVYDSGFLLSVSAVLGIGIIYPALLFNIQNRIYQSLIVSVSATLATLPVVMSSFYRVSRIGVFLNLAIVPLVGILLAGGIATGTLGLIQNYILQTKLDKIIDLLSFPVKYILNLYDFLATKSTSIKGNTWIPGEPTHLQIAVYIILMTCAVYILTVHANSKNGYAGSPKWPWDTYVKRIAGIVIIMLALILISLRPRSELEYRAVSVGQGSCNIIYGKNVPTIMFDCGSTDVKEVFKYRVEPVIYYNGINKIDYVFLSHKDNDHISGFLEMLNDERRNISIGKVFMSMRDDELCKLCSDNGIEYHIINKGDVIKNRDIVIECLSPEYDSSKTWMNTDGNAASIVLKISHINSTFSAMLTGDIDSETEMKIVNDGIFPVTLVAIPHHGSKYSSSPEFLKATDPVISIISCGKGNSYGHPHKETLERLEEYAPKAKVLRTDESGQITVEVNNGSTSVKQYID